MRIHRFAVAFAVLCPLISSSAAEWRHEELRRFPAAEATQGVAADKSSVYIIANAEIGKYRKSNGQFVTKWKAPAGSPIVHLNAGVVRKGRLYCAHSNFPKIPMVSSVEIFDTARMQHIGNQSFGIDVGSLTWVDWRDGHWFACFANYAAQKELTGKDPAWTQLVKFDDKWRRVAAWVFPGDLVKRFGNYSSSGGAFGPGGSLFVSGHDAKELYVLRLPEAGSTLRWTATIPISAEGQAFSFDPTNPQLLYSISRRTREVIISRLTP